MHPNIERLTLTRQVDNKQKSAEIQLVARKGFNCGVAKLSDLLRSDLKVPPYFGREPIKSIISGIHDAKTAYFWINFIKKNSFASIC